VLVFDAPEPPARAAVCRDIDRRGLERERRMHVVDANVQVNMDLEGLPGVLCFFSQLGRSPALTYAPLH
jgi:hypothetical protein